MATAIDGIVRQDLHDRICWLAAYQMAQERDVLAARQLGNASYADGLQHHLGLTDSEIVRRNVIDQVAAVRAELASDHDRSLRILAAGDVVIGQPWTRKPPRGPRVKRRWFHVLAPADMWEA